MFALPLLLGSALPGCGPYRGTRTVIPPLETREHLVYLDAGLTVQIPCETLVVQEREDGRLAVLASFVNQRNRSAECQIKVKFKDRSGVVLEDTGWMPLLLARRETTQFEYTSLTDQAKEYVLELRKAVK